MTTRESDETADLPPPSDGERSLAQSTPAGAAALREGPGTNIGPYTLLQLIGEGGFGSVFMAEQKTPVARTVALKIIKLGMDTGQVIARFEQERQALAVMDHSNIAKVFDAGATETGRPYFVMELCQGDPIEQYCDKNNLSIEQRLELFAQVCTAVQHAHTKGIIHRDIKPSNVLVATQDGRPHAKVIDFGIAKATASKLTEKTFLTEFSRFVGTPEYMSPEQAEGSLDIDARTDVYSLGVLLYELLTGSTPFGSNQLRSAAFGEMQRIIREVDPPSPSTRLSQSTETLVEVAARRRTEPRRLGTIVRGELDWIVMKALEKDRQRRYETANDLAMDVRRYLGGETVVAAPPSRIYRLRKFVRRHRGPVTAGAAIAAALLVGVVAFAWQATVARTQRDRAVAAEGEARKRADELQKVSDFQGQMLAQVSVTEAGKLLTADVAARFAEALARAGVPAGQRAGEVSAFAGQWKRVNATDAARALIDRTILRPAADAIGKQFADQPTVDAKLRQTLAGLYRQLGLYDAALPLQERALATRRRVLGAEHPDTLASINSMDDLLLALGKPGDAEPYCREALEKGRRVLGEEHPTTLIAVNNMGFLLQALGKSGEAEPYFREALEKQRRVLGEEHRDTMVSLDNLSLVLQAQGKLGEAEPFFREALEKHRRVLGEEHPETITTINNLGFLLQFEGKLAEAEPYLREALEKYRRVLGEDHPNTLAALNNLGILLQDQGKLAEAERCLREAMERRRRVLGEEHPDTLGSIGNVGRLLQAEDRLAEAEPYLREALEKKRRVRGEDHPDTLTSLNNLGVLLHAQGKLDEAEPYLREAMAKCRRVLGPDHPNTRISTINTATLLEAQGRQSEAVQLLAPIEDPARKAFTGSNARWLAKLLTTLGKARAALGEFPAAEASLLEAHPLYVTTRGATHKDTRDCTRAIVELYAAWSAREPGKGYDAKAAGWKAKLDAIQPPAAATRPAETK